LILQLKDHVQGLRGDTEHGVFGHMAGW
jgi:hypothetical protein